MTARREGEMPQPMSQEEKDATIDYIIWSHGLSGLHHEREDVAAALEKVLNEPLIDFDNYDTNRTRTRR